MKNIAGSQVRIFSEMSSIAGIDRFDLGLMRPGGVFWQNGIGNLDLDGVLKRLPWLRSENAKGSEIYFRPERGGAWSVIVLDDLTTCQVSKLSKKYPCWVVKTSEDRHHAWILTDGAPLKTSHRFGVQRRLAGIGWGDPAAVSGDRFGRIPGFKNWKRGGVWVNLVSSPDLILPQFDPWTGDFGLGRQDRDDPPSERDGNRDGNARPHGSAGPRFCGEDASESGKEFGWACGFLRTGGTAEEAIRRIEDRARARGKRSPENYARRTVESAKKVL